MAGSVASAQKSAAPCVSTKAARPLRVSTKLALSQVASPVLPQWKPKAPIPKPYPVVAFIRVDDCGGVKVVGVRTPHPPKPVAAEVDAAVTKALLQWKFKPYEHQGHRMPFQFALPFTVSSRGAELDTHGKVDTEPFPK
jgi:hypothetical protein